MKIYPQATAKERAAFNGAHAAGNAQTLEVQRGKEQAAGNRTVQDFAAALRKWAKAFALDHGGIIMYEDIDAFIRRFRRLASVRKGSTGRR